jgi:G6PDH family F420-dependent oxidoreductase
MRVARIGVFLSSEEHGPQELLRQAEIAEQAGYEALFISDHYHPWTDAQGESPFVWSVIGAIAARTGQRVMTGVTCPIQRIHPAVLAQAAATSQLLLGGGFSFGVGTGEALNEHITGARWPEVNVRLEMLEEAIGILRELWTGKLTSHHGRHFTVENARIYSLPDEPPPIHVSAFGPKAAALAARVGDGLVTVAPKPDIVQRYRAAGGKGKVIAAAKFCWGEDEAQARKLAHELWPTEAVQGQISQELPMPSHFVQATAQVSEEMVANAVPCGPDPQVHAAALQKYLDAGFDEIYVNQIGSDLGGFLRFFDEEVRPLLV